MANNDIDPNQPPIKPTLSIINVNVNSMLYMWKLTVHYFQKQPNTKEQDHCFIMTGSMVLWIDSPVRTQNGTLFRKR